ncbi:MAG: hypothetical protein ACK5WT_09490 [Betaproteobacteria bacterium]
MDDLHELDALLRRLGERIAGDASAALAACPADGPAARTLARLEELGVRLQALERVAGGHSRQAPETVDLGMALVQLRAERAHDLASRGQQLEGPDQGLDIRLSAGVLKQALDLAIDHALALGSTAVATVGLHGVPPLPTLMLTVPLGFDEAFGLSPEELDELHFTLLGLLCRRGGIHLERDVQAHRVLLRRGFVPAN